MPAKPAEASGYAGIFGWSSPGEGFLEQSTSNLAFLARNERTFSQWRVSFAG
jgi:hypothetical protein